MLKACVAKKKASPYGCLFAVIKRRKWDGIYYLY